MEYQRPYQLPFQRKDWLNNFLLMIVCGFIPFIGAIVIFGYLAQIMERWVRDGNDQRQKPFDFSFFSEYLQRGIWPFVYMLIIRIPMGLTVGILYFATIMLFVFSKNPAISFIASIMFLLSIICLQIVIRIINWPFTLHAQLTAKFDFGDAFRFAKDFYSRIGFFNLIGIAVCITLLDMVCSLIGMILLCIGSLPAAIVIVFADNHFLWQLYRKYLANGGREIELFEPEFSYEKSDEQPNEGI